MAIDWTDQTRIDKLTFQMVSPTNIDQSYGELEHVDLSGSSLTAAYYTDTRTSGKLRVIDSNWVRGSMIRVIHEVPAANYKNELGTYIVTADPATRENGAWITELTLHSRLYGLSLEKHGRVWTLAKGSRALKAISDSLTYAKCPYTTSGANDKKYTSAKVVDAGTTRLAALFDICNASDNRIDVNAHGRVTVSKYVNPSSKSPAYRIDLADEHGIAVDGLELETDWLGIVDQTVISHKYSEKSGRKSVEKTITAIANASSSAHQSRAVRGYTITDFQSLSELEPKTQAHAQSIANNRLKADSRELVEWSLTTMYIPVWEGDVVQLVVHDGPKAYQGVRKCLVKAIDLALDTMTMKLTLKETASGTKGDED